MLKPIAYLYGYTSYYCRLAVYYAAMAINYVRVYVFEPWWLARFNAAWLEYRDGSVYRERLANLGLAYAINTFIESKWERKYCLKLRCRKERQLRWKLIFMPF